MFACVCAFACVFYESMPENTINLSSKMTLSCACIFACVCMSIWLKSAENSKRKIKTKYSVFKRLWKCQLNFAQNICSNWLVARREKNLW